MIKELGNTLKISFTISAYNQKDSVKKLIDQLKPYDVEIIVGEDGSRQLTSFCYKEGYKYVWQNDRGFRLASLRNLMIEEATGDLIVFIDGDCQIKKPVDFFIAGLINTAKRFDLIGFDRLTYKDGELVERISDNWETPKIRSWWNYRGGAMAAKKELIEEIGGFDERYDGSWGIEDSDFVVRALKAGAKADNFKQLKLIHNHHEQTKPEKLKRNQDMFLKDHGHWITWGSEGVIE